MIRGAALLALMAGAASAQSADPRGQAAEAYVACMAGGTLVEMTDALLTGVGWTRHDDGESGLVTFAPASGEATMVTMAEGTFCLVESTALSSATALEVLDMVAHNSDHTSFVVAKDAAGCTRYDFDSDISATVTSAGNDPTCASDTNSGVRFEPTVKE